MNIYFIQYKCRPMHDSPNDIEFNGASVRGWIQAQSLGNAIAIYTHAVKENGWFPFALEKGYQVHYEDYNKGDEALEYFEHAQVDGESYIVEPWGSNKPSAENKIH